jgi:uncharacterized protein YgiM (DUF1202 family)
MKNNKEKKVLTHMTQAYKIFFFLLVLFGSYGNANEYLPIIKMTEKWSASHNDKNVNALELLYANKLNYYSSDFSRKKVLSDKKIFFNKYPYFSHKVQNIKVTYIGMEQYYVKFNKYVKQNLSDSNKMYPSYLVFKQIGENYKIIVEGDKVTDKNLYGDIQSPGLYKVKTELNVRQEPHKHSVVLDIMKKNNLIHIDIFVGKWGKSNHGWLSSKYLQLLESKDDDIGREDATQDATTLHLSEEYTSMRVPARYKVTTYKLNVRELPDKSSKVLATVKKGDSVYIYEFHGKWGRSDGGWISGKHLIFEESVSQSNNSNAVENNDTKTETSQWYYWVGIIIILYFVLKIFYQYIKRKRRELANEERRKRRELANEERRKQRELANEERRRKREERIKYLLKKYKKQEYVDNIMNKKLWIDETTEQIRESMGEPLDIDTHVTKTKRKETWKYNRSGKNRYNLKIYIENGIVVGWEDK